MEKVVLELKELNKKYQKLLGINFPVDENMEDLKEIELRIKLIDEMYQVQLGLKTTVWKYTQGCSTLFMQSKDIEPKMRYWLERYIEDIELLLQVYAWDFGTLMDNIKYTDSLNIFD